MAIRDGTDTKLHSRDEEKVEEPKDYLVILLNDNYTPQNFVVEILMVIFHKNREEAERIMLNVHFKQRGIVGQYTYDIAQTKANQVHIIAKENEYPLKCIVEEV